MLFEKLIQQHRVHRVVAHDVDLAFVVAHHQVGVYLGHLLSDQAKLRCTGVVGLVMERHRLKRQNSFAGAVHRFNLFLEAPRRTGGAKLTQCVYQHWYSGIGGCHPANASDKGACLIPVYADAYRAVLARKTWMTDIDIVIARGTHAGAKAQSDVVDASSVAKESVMTDGRVVVACHVEFERSKTVGRVRAAGDVAKERLKTGGRVVAAFAVVQKGKRSVGRVVRSSGVEEKRYSASSRICVCGVERKRASANACVKAAGRVAEERKPTNCRVPLAGAEVFKGVLPLRSVEVGIASVRNRDDCLCDRGKRKEAKRQEYCG